MQFVNFFCAIARLESKVTINKLLSSFIHPHNDYTGNSFYNTISAGECFDYTLLENAVDNKFPVTDLLKTVCSKFVNAFEHSPNSKNSSERFFETFPKNSWNLEF